MGNPNYRELKKKLAEEGKGNWVLMPLYPYSATESLLDLPGTPPHEPSREHIFGTDDPGRDVFARLAYGFNVSLTFALLVIAIGVHLRHHCRRNRSGTSAGQSISLGQRLIEIWSALPFLYTIIIVSSIVVPNYITRAKSAPAAASFWLLIAILAIFDWMGITYYVRGEFYREKAKDYVGAAIAMGVSEAKIMFKHILPNALTPVVSFAPFAHRGEYQRTCRSGFSGLWIAGANAKLGRADRCRRWTTFQVLVACFLSTRRTVSSLCS